MIELFNNLDLFFVGCAVAGILLLGFTIFLSDRKSITNSSFLFFSIFTAVWSTINYTYYQFNNIELSFLFLKLVIFFGVWFVFFLFRMLYVFPSRTKIFPAWFNYVLFPLAIITSVLTLTPFVFEKVLSVDSAGRIAQIQNGPGIFLFAGVVLFFVFSALFILIRKILNTANKIEKRQVTIISIGLLITFASIMTFNLILPAFFNTANFISFGALFILPFVVATAYAIHNGKLFHVDVKIAGVVIIALILAGVGFTNIIYAESGSQIILNIVYLLGIAIGSIDIIKRILSEIILRKALEISNQNLETVNSELTNLTKQIQDVNRVLSHDVKAALGKNGQLFLEINEGTFDNNFPILKSMAKQLYLDDNSLLQSVMNILANKGGKPVPRVFNLKDAVLGAIEMVDKNKIKEKNIKIETSISNEEDYTIFADRDQISTHVLQNLINNSVIYNTQNGHVKIKLNKKNPSTFHFEIENNGPGISDDDKKVIFTEGGHGKESFKLNKNTSGEGLFLAKRDVDAHNGKIWFESEVGVGVTFFFDIPVDFTNPETTTVKVPSKS